VGSESKAIQLYVQHCQYRILFNDRNLKAVCSIALDRHMQLVDLGDGRLELSGPMNKRSWRAVENLVTLFLNGGEAIRSWGSGVELSGKNVKQPLFDL